MSRDMTVAPAMPWIAMAIRELVEAYAHRADRRNDWARSSRRRDGIRGRAALPRCSLPVIWYARGIRRVELSGGFLQYNEQYG